MNRSTVDVWVGALVALGLGALLFLAVKASNFSTAQWSETYVLQAKFDNIGGLKVRGPVKSAGVVVGRIADIRFDPQTYEAVVTLHIGSPYRFPKDTFASVYTSGLLGEQYVGLDAGGDDAMLAPGETLTKTQSAVVLEKLVSQLLFSKASDGQGKP